jgi:hypothetical protein
MTDNAPKLHHYLVSGKVFTIDPENEDAGVGSTEINATITSDQPYVTAREIGRAQQALQMNLFQRAQNPNIQVVDLNIGALIYLGEMTEAVFAAGMPQTQAA